MSLQRNYDLWNAKRIDRLVKNNFLPNDQSFSYLQFSVTNIPTIAGEEQSFYSRFCANKLEIARFLQLIILGNTIPSMVVSQHVRERIGFSVWEFPVMECIFFRISDYLKWLFLRLNIYFTNYKSGWWHEQLTLLGTIKLLFWSEYLLRSCITTYPSSWYGFFEENETINAATWIQCILDSSFHFELLEIRMGDSVKHIVLIGSNTLRISSFFDLSFTERWCLLMRYWWHVKCQCGCDVTSNY